ncbi:MULTISPECIES: hypothetical protein [Enterococcus]|uniref:Uncharacterized protein n=1 Tax=Enterococcus malodoratus ATCC 43197 TaxID=1158601 RepID=R2NJT4_9ENTE|nr:MULTISPECIES: hypothetical protein [Enterococcus]BBM19880.1 hypothetical protein G15_3561 [Enterococcus avium]EOH72317.1 hypothetical protein UAI_03901 [Enterococcus malodoratus ATCC 43197]EOT70358.1 hypothetical protein I585_01838 [Enterococcus malodoratus ATCC 43197]OJG58948.1 hypothetical protein RV07_GL002742 [Enterococcus malodoratus]SET25379.1 hypothetical protein SAMN04487821_108155 [Enterococcus malodoratus]
MKKVVALVAVLGAAFLFFWFNQKDDVAVEDKATPDFSQTEQVEHREDFFTNRDLNELEQVTYSRHKELTDDLTGEGKLVRKSTQKEFVGAKANEDGLTWTGYFEK